MSDLPRAILIDLDDTLLDDSSYAETCWADSLASFAGRFGVVRPHAIAGAIQRQASWFWSDPQRHREGRLNLHVATRTVVQRAFEDVGIGDEALAGELADMYRDLREERATLFPGALEALEGLRSRGVRLGMMTNGAADAQRRKIERFGLETYFNHVVIEGEFGVGKPDRRVFETLLRKLVCEPVEAWAIGDNLEFDVLAPMELGLHGIWINGSGASCNGQSPDRVVPAFTDITG